MGYSFDFKDFGGDLKSVQVQLQTRFDKGTIFYTLDGKEPTFAATKYTVPFSVDRSLLLRMVAYDTNFNADEIPPVPINLLRSRLSAWTLGG